MINLNFIKTKVRRFLDIETKGSGSYSLEMFPEWGRFEKVKENDKTSMVEAIAGWVYACINVLAFNVAKVPSYVYKHTGKEDRLIEQHPYYDRMKNPNPYTIEWEFKFLLQANLDATGEAFIYHPLTPIQRPGALYLLPSHLVIPRIVDGHYFYDCNYGSKSMTFTEEEVLFLKYPNVKNPNRGLGPLEASRMGINLDSYMSQYQLSLLANRARPDGLLKSDQDISGEEAKRSAKVWKKQFGGVDKTGGIAVLGKGLDYTKISLSLEELEFLKSREFNKDEIAGIFNVPRMYLSKVQDVNRSTAETVEYLFQKNVIEPRLVLRDSYLTKLVQLYDETLIIKSDNVIPKDKEFDLEEQGQDLKNAVRIINEVREARGLDPVNWGKLPYLPFSLQPVGSAPPEQPEKVYTNTKDIKQWKEQYWKVYVRKTINEERLMISKLKSYFKEQEKIVLRNIRKYGKGYKADISFFLFAMSEWNDKLVKIMKPLVQASVLSGGESLIQDFGLDVSFDIASPFVSEFFSMREMKITHINRETFDKLTKQLEEGIREGETIKELSARVETVYNEAEGYRSRMIARTETNVANNFGHMESMRLAGIERKEWITAGDEDVRFEHGLNELQGCVDFNSEFHGTNEQYPGEINCRCVVIPCMEK